MGVNHVTKAGSPVSGGSLMFQANCHDAKTNGMAKRATPPDAGRIACLLAQRGVKALATNRLSWLSVKSWRSSHGSSIFAHVDLLTAQATVTEQGGVSSATRPLRRLDMASVSSRETRSSFARR